MTQLITTNAPFQVEEDDGYFKFLTQSGWTMASFAVKDIPDIITLLRILQKECSEEERASDANT